MFKRGTEAHPVTMQEPSDQTASVKERRDKLSFVGSNRTRSGWISEIALQLRVAQGGDEVPLRAVVDSGAGRSYLIAGDNQPFVLEKSPTPYRVELADGRVSTINTLVRLDCRVWDVGNKKWFRPIRLMQDPDLCDPNGPSLLLRVLRSRAPSKPYLLLGRDVIQCWGLESRAVASAWISGRLVFSRGSSVDVRYSEERLCVVRSYSSGDAPIDTSCVSGHEEGDLTSTDIVPLPKVDASTTLRVTLTLEDENLVRSLLESVVVSGWKDIPGCREYRTRIRKVHPGEWLDCTSQEYVAELALPRPKRPKVEPRDFAIPLYHKLAEPLKQIYRATIQEYVESHWWVRVGAENSTSALPYASVFMTGYQTGKKPRLVCDLRSANSALPRVQSRGEHLWLPLCLLRATSSICIATSDVRSAFYSIRFAGSDVIDPSDQINTLQMRTGIGDFECLRVCFGICCGTCSLKNTYGSLISVYRSSKLARKLGGWIQEFVDDLFLSGSIRSVLNNLCNTLYLLVLVAFLVPEKKLAITAAVTAKALLRQALVDRGLSLPPANCRWPIRYQCSM